MNVTIIRFPGTNCDLDTANAVKKVLGIIPYMVDGADFCGATRRRLYWCSWKLYASPHVLLSQHKKYIHVSVHVKHSARASWLDEEPSS